MACSGGVCLSQFRNAEQGFWGTFVRVAGNRCSRAAVDLAAFRHRTVALRMSFYSVKDGLHVTINTDRIPGSDSAFTVNVDVKFEAGFLSNRLGIQQGKPRSFAGKLAEAVDLLEVSDDEVRQRARA